MAHPATQVPRWVVVSAVAACIAVGALLCGVTAALYGDGSVMLVQAINAGGSFVSRNRWLLNDVRDSPVVLLVRLGVEDNHALAVAQSIGYVGSATIVWATAIFLARLDRRLFTVVTIAAGVCVGTMASFGAVELLLALAIVSLLTVILGSPGAWTTPRAVTAVVSSAVLVIAHESLIACAVIWGAHAGWRVVRAAGAVERLAALVVAGAAVASIAWGVMSLAAVPEGGSLGFLVPIQTLMPASAALVLAGAMATAGAVLGWARIGFVGHTVLLGAGALWTLAGVVIAIRLGPGASYHSRTWSLLAILLMQVFVLVVWARRSAAPSVTASGGDRHVVGIAVAFLAMALLIPIGNAILWAQGLGDVRAAVTEGSGLLRPEGLPELGQRALFSWTNPYLSVVLRSDDDDAVVIDAHPEVQAWVPDPVTSVQQAQRVLPREYTWR